VFFFFLLLLLLDERARIWGFEPTRGSGFSLLEHTNLLLFGMSFRTHSDGVSCFVSSFFSYCVWEDLSSLIRGAEVRRKEEEWIYIYIYRVLRLICLTVYLNCACMVLGPVHVIHDTCTYRLERAMEVMMSMST
jgi:hypothetical protein